MGSSTNFCCCTTRDDEQIVQPDQTEKYVPKPHRRFVDMSMEDLNEYQN